VGRFLIIAGLLIAALGALVHWGLPVGRLPGDVIIRRGGFTLYFPIVTGLLVSLLLTLLFSLFRR
jgi:hypothetical protein